MSSTEELEGFITEEIKYVETLQNCITTFYEPLEKLLSKHVLLNIFVNYKQIGFLHGNFIKELTDIKKSEKEVETLTKISEVFKKFVPFMLNSYTVYIRNLTKLNLESLTKTNDAFGISMDFQKLKSLQEALNEPKQVFPRFSKFLLKLSFAHDDLTTVYKVVNSINSSFDENPSKNNELEQFITQFNKNKIVLQEKNNSMIAKINTGDIVLLEKINDSWIMKRKFLKSQGDFSPVFEHQREKFSFFYVAESGYLGFCFFHNEEYKFDESSFKSAGKVKGKISAVYEHQRDHCAVMFIGENNYIHYFYVNEFWRHDYKSFYQYPCTGDLCMFYEEFRNHTAIVYESNERLVYMFVDDRIWSIDSSSFENYPISGGSICGIDENFGDDSLKTGIYFVGKDNLIHYFHNTKENAKWKSEDEKFEKNFVFGDLQAFYSVKSQKFEFCVSSINGFDYYSRNIKNDWEVVKYELKNTTKLFIHHSNAHDDEFSIMNQPHFLSMDNFEKLKLIFQTKKK
eukprot:gene1471-12089_t